MKKLTVENLNAFIEEGSSADKTGKIAIPKSMKYPEDVILDYRKLVDRKGDIEDFIRQTLPFFSDNAEARFPSNYFGFLGEPDGKGSFNHWTDNADDITRLIVLGMYARIIDRPQKAMVNTRGGQQEMLTHKVLSHLRPAIVTEERPMTKAKEPDAK